MKSKAQRNVESRSLKKIVNARLAYTLLKLGHKMLNGTHNVLVLQTPRRVGNFSN
jgi:hypothetical protein